MENVPLQTRASVAKVHMLEINVSLASASDYSATIAMSATVEANAQTLTTVSVMSQTCGVEIHATFASNIRAQACGNGSLLVYPALQVFSP